MSDCCDKSPLQRSGINQSHRLLAALKAGYILIDERDYADWIFFADEFSHYLKYYNSNGTVAGDWKPFFSNDISAILGSIAVQEVEVYRLGIKYRFDFIKKAESGSDLLPIKQKLNELFSSILTLSKALDNYLLKLPDKHIDGESDFVFKTNLLNIIKTKLSPALRRLLSYYFAIDGADENNVSNGSTNYLSNSELAGWKVLNNQVEEAAITIWNNTLSNHWWNTNEPDWRTFVHNLAAAQDDTVFGNSGWSDMKRINHAVNHNLFSSIFDQYLQAYSRIVQDSEKALLATLESWNTHPAHYTLFLSFLKLFRFAQSDINTVTQKHLDFYYKEVLQLKPKAAEPNHAHILIELAKQIDAYALKQGTEYKAGKDSDGKEVIYALDSEETFNKAKVVLLRSVYKGDKDGKDDHLAAGSTTTEINNRGRLFGSPVANSNDGEGAKLRSVNKEWHPYVNKVYTDGRLTDIAMPNAQVGLAVASHYLYMAEGERKIYIRLSTVDPADNSKLTTATLEAYLTTAKGWYKVPLLTPGASVITGGTPCAQILLEIPGDAPEITKYNSEVHGGAFNCTTPLVKIYLTNEEGTSPYPYDDLSGIRINKIEIEVKVGLDNNNAVITPGLKNLLLSGDIGIIDPSKPFTPFGTAPKKGASFTIGSPELFIKKNAKIFLRIEWKDLPVYGFQVDFNAGSVTNNVYIDPNPSVKVQSLARGKWENIPGAGDLKILSDFKLSFSPPVFDVFPREDVIIPGSLLSLPENIFSPVEEEYKSYSVSSNNGFIKLILNTGFGHEEYQKALTKYLIDQAKTPLGPSSDPGVAPYTPTIKLFSVHYTASAISTISENGQNNFKNRDVQLFHIYPFGEAEQHAYLTGSSEIFLLPQFTHKTNSIPVDHIAEFYIGIEKLKAQQSVNILFQLMEGSSNPMVIKPPGTHVQWSYLGNDRWNDFDDQQLSDATRQLVQSGIISFVIPENATTDNTLLPAGFVWLRAAVSEAAEAVCKLISVDAQAAVVTYQPKDNAENFLDTALPAGAISKLKAPSSSVKKTVQPYSSFGGRAKESNENFYVRVSERLRHKARAITIWDYENLVLEAFPGLHKVKCLNHTKFEKNKDTNTIEYNEVAPGYVTLITIPDLTNRNDTNPLRPFTNQNILLEVEEYLKKKISCHVKLSVKNPRFEEIWLSFKLKLVKGFDDFTFYADQLREEITQYLTPWAYSSSADIQFGGKIHKSTLIDFIEERPYVDFITDVKMYHDTNPDNEDAGDCDENANQPPGSSGNLEVVEASTARSILVSTPASKHNIEEITAQDIEEKSECAGHEKTIVT